MYNIKPKTDGQVSLSVVSKIKENAMKYIYQMTVAAWWAFLAIFALWNFIGAIFNVGMLSQMPSTFPILYWFVMFPMGLFGTTLFCLLSYYQADI